MLEGRGLRKRIRSRTILDGVSLAVEPGTIVGLLGPNGAGKTTCFQVLAGLEACEEGTVVLDGVDVTDLPLHVRARRGVGYLPQEPSVFRHLDVERNVRAVLQLRQDLDATDRRLELGRLLDELQIAHLAQQRAATLSGGERRRVEIARALAAAPRYMLLDEPFAGIDPIALADVQRVVRHLAERGIGVLVTDHNVRETLGLCDHAFILAGGRVIAAGGPGDVLADRAVREAYLGAEFRI